jgi:hypothetical protein
VIVDKETLLQKKSLQVPKNGGKTCFTPYHKYPTIYQPGYQIYRRSQKLIALSTHCAVRVYAFAYALQVSNR